MFHTCRHATEVLTALCTSSSGGGGGGAAVSGSHLTSSTLADILNVVLDADDQVRGRPPLS